MFGNWIEKAREILLQHRGHAAGWGYRPETAPCVEPTVLACLGLMASDRDRRSGHPAAEVRRSADWIAALQRRDGSLGVSATLPTPGWATPYGVLLWAALDGYRAHRERAARWLLDQEGTAVPIPAPSERTVGHDTTIVGWPWVADTHSWLEPTALTVLALRHGGKADHPRVGEGLRLIRDRAIATGGWNYGNNVAFGRDLRPQPAPTGLALLALSGPGGRRTEIVERATRYLRGALAETRATHSLCWGVLGLRAWGCCPGAVDGWLSRAFEQPLSRHDSSLRSAHLLLAAGERSLELLGLSPERGDRHEG
jgi:hypothetical protein